MKRYLLILIILLISLAVTVSVGYGQVSSKKKYKTEVRYALSGSLTVYAKPFTTARVIGQLIYNETIQVVVDSDQIESGSDWVHIVYPYEGFYQQSKPPENIKEEEIAVISREQPKKKIEEEKKAGEEENMAEKSESADEKEDDEAETEETEEVEEGKSEAAQRLFAGKKDYLLGIGGSAFTVPEEEGYETSGTPMDIYFEFLDKSSLLANIRLGLNSAAEEDDDYKVSTISLYVAYRVIFDQLSTQDLKPFGFAGPAAMYSSITGLVDKTATSVGLMVGLGGSYRLFWELRVGAQAVYFTNQQDFGDVKRFVGSTQALLTMDYSF